MIAPRRFDCSPPIRRTPDEAPPGIVLPDRQRQQPARAPQSDQQCAPGPANNPAAPGTGTSPAPAVTPRPEPDVAPDRAAEIARFVEENKDGMDNGFFGWGKSENSGQRYVDAMEGKSSLGELSGDEQRLLSQGMAEAWRADNDGHQYFTAMTRMGDSQRAVMQEEAIYVVAADQRERPKLDDPAIAGMPMSDFTASVLNGASGIAPATLLAAFEGRGARLGVLAADKMSGVARDGMLEFIAQGGSDPTTSREFVDALYLSTPPGDRNRDAFAHALAATRRPGDSETDRLGRETLVSAYDAFMAADRTSVENVPPTLQLALLDEIQNNPAFTAQALKDGWESDVVSQWLAESAIEGYAGRGTDPQKLSGEALRNTLGQSLGIVPDNLPAADATQAEIEAIYAKGMDHAYYGENETIDNLQIQLAKAAGLPSGDAANAEIDLTIIPVTVTNNSEGAVTFPVYRVETEGGAKFVDHTGRVYDNLQDWEDNNVLPSGRMTYPAGLDMNNAGNLVSRNTPEVNDTWQEHALAIGDGVAMVAGITALGVFVVGTGGTGGALLLAGGVGAGVWSAGRMGASLYDDSQHSVDISDLSDPAVRAKWIEMAASGLSAGAGGVGLAVRGGIRLGATGSRVAATTTLAATAADGAAITNQAVTLAGAWDQMDNGQRAAGLLNLAFYGGMGAMSLRAGGNSMNFNRVANQFEFGTPYAMRATSDLADGQIRVAYETGPNGRARDIRLEYGGSLDRVDPQMLAIHSETARAMEASGGLRDRIDGFLRRADVDRPAPGTAAWEARYEIGKIDTEISQINARLSEGGMSPYEIASSRARLDELNTALQQQNDRIPLTNAEGEGWVASPSTGAQQAQQLGWPTGSDVPAGYVWVSDGTAQPRLDRLPDNNGRQLRYDPLAGSFVERPATPPRGDRLPEDIVARNKEISDWMRANGHDRLTAENAQDVIAQYRATSQPPLIDSRGGAGTIAAVEIDGQVYIGLNSHNLEGGTGMALNREWADNAGLSAPDERATAFHAEAHALMQAHEANGGSLPSSVTIYSDRPPCPACKNHLQTLAEAMGVTNIKIDAGKGTTYETVPDSKRIDKEAL